jgi:hypothetical protein
MHTRLALNVHATHPRQQVSILVVPTNCALDVHTLIPTPARGAVQCTPALY